MGKKKPTMGVESLFLAAVTGGTPPRGHTLMDTPVHYSFEDVQRLAPMIAEYQHILACWQDVARQAGATLAVQYATMLEGGHLGPMAMKYSLRYHRPDGELVAQVTGDLHTAEVVIDGVTAPVTLAEAGSLHAFTVALQESINLTNAPV